MKTIFRKCLRTMAFVGLALCLQTVPATAGNAKTIIFRDDDAQAFFSTDLLEFITDTLITNGIPQTIAVIPANDATSETLSSDQELVAYLNAIKTNPKVELALHGYKHAENEFGSLTLSQAQSKIVAGLAVMSKVLGVTPTTFVPPDNVFNTNTLTACKNKGITRFSAASYDDPNLFAEAPVGLLHVPETVDFQDWDNGGVFRSSAAIIQDAQHSLDVNDVAVVTIHFWAFGDENANLISANYQTLLDVVGWALQKQSGGVALMTIGQFTRTKIIGLSGNLAFGNVTSGTAATNTLTITNSGSSTLTVSGISCPAGFSGTWSGSIAVGGSQKVPVAFAPTAVKSYNGNVKVTSDANSGTATLAASGTGIAVVKPTKIIGLSGNLTFGNVTTGTTAIATLTIANSGNAPLTVSSVSYPAGFSGAWSGLIAAGGSQNVLVTFAPTAIKSYSGNVKIISDATSGTATLAASGKGSAAAQQTKIIGVSGNLAFGNVTTGSAATATLMITNSGNATLTVSSISYPVGFSGGWSGTVAAGGSQNVLVTFAPTAVTSYSGNLTVNSDATGGTGTIAASGMGSAAIIQTKIIGLSGNLAFGNATTGTTATATLTIVNSGNATMTVSSISYPDGFSGVWSGTVAAGSSQNVVVTFAPTAVSSYSATVTVNSDATSGTAIIAASGAGIAVVTQTLQVTIQASSDDAYEADGEMYTSAFAAVAGISDTTIYRAGYRFATVGLPKNAKVLGARLKLAYNWASASQVNTLLYGEATDSSTTFSTAVTNISSRTLTSNSVQWNAMAMTSWGQVLASPDLTAIVQEIVSRPQWMSGNPITILQYESGSVQGTWEAITVEGANGTPCPAAVLEIDYTQ